MYAAKKNFDLKDSVLIQGSTRVSFARTKHYFRIKRKSRKAKPTNFLVETTRRKAHREMIKSLRDSARQNATTCDNSVLLRACPRLIMAAGKSVVNDFR